MRRFEDCWVIDKTMIDFVNQAGCSCGVPQRIMSAASGAECCSDRGAAALIGGQKDAKLSPWPALIQNEIAVERTRLEKAMKAEMDRYKTFADAHSKGFSEWWLHLPVSAKIRVLKVSDADLMEYFRSHVKVKSSYEIVLHAVTEQLRHFSDTGYSDGAVRAESYMEPFLKNRRSAFVMDSEYLSSVGGAANFCEMLKLLAGPNLLPSRQTASGNENNQGDNEAATSIPSAQGFRSDRRLVRIAIFRKFADVAMQQYIRDGVRKVCDEESESNQVTAD